MSILTKGMEMPQSCNECLLSMETACGLSGKIVPDYWGRDDRPSWCELIELPPHGRLIDADALMSEIKNFPYGYRGMIANTIANMPTIIEAEVEDGI